VFIVLCLLDALFEPPGLILIPLFFVCILMLTGEVLDLMHAVNMYPRRSTVYLGNLVIAACCWGGCLWRELNMALGEEVTDKSWQWSSTASVWTLLGLAVGVLLGFVAEMKRFQRPGSATINLAGAIFALIYIGLLSSFIIQLRMAYGLLAVCSVIIVTKMTDVGAYAFGRLFGRNKMAPGLSPRKTIEGALGGLLFAFLGAWFSFAVLMYDRSNVSMLEILLYGLVVGLSGMVGDLAESLLKRDAQMKDSSKWIPGFGGLLDIFDSLLLAGPVAFAWWAFDLVR
jgi:phosphatidate cytidylyltransferase